MLDGGYNVFGYVVEGQPVVNSITKGDTMRTVRIVRVGRAAKEFDAVKAFSNGEEELKKKQEAAAKLASEAWDKKVKAKYPTAKKTASGLYYVIDVEGYWPYSTAWSDGSRSLYRYPA